MRRKTFRRSSTAHLIEGRIAANFFKYVPLYNIIERDRKYKLSRKQIIELDKKLKKEYKYRRKHHIK